MPALYIPLRRLRRADTVVGQETELVIEGFPRCGNTWAEMAIRHAATGPVKLAHHSHASAHVKRAIALKKPVLVLFREPDAAVRSLLAMDRGNLTAADAFEEYVIFYRHVLRLDQKWISYASFEDVTQRMNRVLNHLNQRYGFAFSQIDEESVSEREAIFARMDARAREIRPDRKAVSQSNPTHFDKRDRALKEQASAEIDRLGDRGVRQEALTIFDHLRSDVR